MRIVVLGGSGHIGSFLIPRLVHAGHEVINVSRGRRSSYVDDDAWRHVQQDTADREAEDRDGTFPQRVADLHAEVVVDLICFTLGSATALVDRLRGEAAHLVHCGSIWRHGPSRRAPMREDDPTPPVGDYGIEKAAIGRMLKEETEAGGLLTTSLHPGHISGPGWHPIGPLGNLDPAVWRRLSAGERIDIPGFGAEFMSHVHADDVAQAFEAAIGRRDAAAGEDFDIVAPTALNVRGYAELAASWFGRTADLRSVSWDAFASANDAEHVEASRGHLERGQVVSIEKARRLLGYHPRFQPEEAILEAVRWLVEHQELEVAGPLQV